jgi:[calcium/calmodulin-dependent protein kinase] kinase
MADEIGEPKHDDILNAMNEHPKPKPSRYASTPSSESPQRHYRRNPKVRRPVKETLNARSEYTTSQDDGTAEHRINQYVIKQEIGRGSFGAVHLAVDQYGNEFAVKEFSKSRLRKRAQSHLLRKPRGRKRPSDGFNSPLHRHPSGNEDEHGKNPLYLIKEEIAIMKKLNHNNLVSLIEVLDDPTEDSLYMVMEMCKKGVIMKVGLEERADPYSDEQCRCWFRDLILGIEYLHGQGIVHRDIKPDNCLLTNDDVLKIVDFGVSEMFAKDSDMFTAKSAGSPAFLPPELCVVKHGDVSGRAADIWSMGVTLYCLRYGRLPFEKQSIFELYEAIKNDPVVCEEETDDNFKDLILRILEKDPSKRITMRELRAHPWVTRNGSDLLLPEEENIAQIVEPPTEEEMNTAITRNVGHIMAVMKAAKRFKRLLGPAKADPVMQSILGQEYESHFVEPPLEMDPEEGFSASHILMGSKSQSVTSYNREPQERENVLRGYHQQREKSPEISDSASKYTTQQNPVLGSSTKHSVGVTPERQDSGSISSCKLRTNLVDDLQTTFFPQSPSPQKTLSRASSATTKRSVEGTRGHARDPLEEVFPYLFIGPSTYTGSVQEGEHDTDMERNPYQSETLLSDEPLETTLAGDEVIPIVSESPGAAEFDIYETAYRQEIARIRKLTLAREGSLPKVYLTRRVEDKDEVLRLVEHGSLGTNLETAACEADAVIGEKITAPSSPRSGVSMIKTQLNEQLKLDANGALAQNQLSASATTADREPETSPIAATKAKATGGSLTSSPENAKTKLKNLFDRVRGNNDP